MRDFVRKRHASEYTVRPYRPVVVDGKGLDDIAPPARLGVPPLMRGYLRLGAKVCGEPAHDPDFGVGDFPALLDKREADVRYLTRLRSVSQATDMAAGGIAMSSHDLSEQPLAAARVLRRALHRRSTRNASRRSIVALRTTGRVCCALLLFAAVPLLAVPLPGRVKGSAVLLPADAALPRRANHGVRRADSQPAVVCWWSAVTCRGSTSS